MAPLSLYDISIPSFIANLKIVSSLLDKALIHDASKEEIYANARLIEDMHPLVYQIQRISDRAKGLAVRVAGTQPVPMEDNERTFADMQQRIKKTIEVLEKLDPNIMDGMEDKEVILQTADGGERKFTGSSYILSFVIPNFYFNFCMIYALLRKEGVPIGKDDYLGGLLKSG